MQPLASNKALHRQSDEDRERVGIEFALVGEFPSEGRPLPGTNWVRGLIHLTINQLWVRGSNGRASEIVQSRRGEDAASNTAIKNENGRGNSGDGNCADGNANPSAPWGAIGGGVETEHIRHGNLEQHHQHLMHTTICN